MNRPWWIVEGFPFLLCCLVWALLLWAAWRLWRMPKSTGDTPSAKHQSSIYKRGGALLLMLGTIGFTPSIGLLLFKGHIWSVNEQGPHPSVDFSLFVHIPLAVIWIGLVAHQLWSGNVAKRRKFHRRLGWIAVLAVVIGVGLFGGWIWPLLNDFSQGLNSPTAGAGIYTMLMGLGVGINGIMAAVYAKRKQFPIHQDFALMTLFWTMDPALHRLYLWLMRLFCWECWAPENTGDLGIAIAKLPANISLIIWAILLGIFAGRLNRIIVINTTGQFFLWLLGTNFLLKIYMPAYANTIIISSVILALMVLCLWYTKVSLKREKSALEAFKGRQV